MLSCENRSLPSPPLPGQTPLLQGGWPRPAVPGSLVIHCQQKDGCGLNSIRPRTGKRPVAPCKIGHHGVVWELLGASRNWLQREGTRKETHSSSGRFSLLEPFNTRRRCLENRVCGWRFGREVPVAVGSTIASFCLAPPLPAFFW